MATDIKGMWVIAVARCSSDEQIEKSIPQQEEAIKAYMARNQMTLVEFIRLEGVSATRGEHMTVLLDLIAKKIAGEPFDALLFYDHTRVARNTVDGNRLQSESADAELHIITVTEGLIEGRDAWIKLGLIYSQSEAYVRLLSVNTNRGMMAAILSGRLPHSNINPLGIDRLYIDDKERHLFVLRNLPGGV